MFSHCHALRAFTCPRYRCCTYSSISATNNTTSACSTESVTFSNSESLNCRIGRHISSRSNPGQARGFVFVFMFLPWLLIGSVSFTTTLLSPSAAYTPVVDWTCIFQAFSNQNTHGQSRRSATFFLSIPRRYTCKHRCSNLTNAGDHRAFDVVPSLLLSSRESDLLYYLHVELDTALYKWRS